MVVDELALAVVLVLRNVEAVHAYQPIESQSDLEPSPGHKVGVLHVDALVAPELLEGLAGWQALDAYKGIGVEETRLVDVVCVLEVGDAGEVTEPGRRGDSKFFD